MAGAAARRVSGQELGMASFVGRDVAICDAAQAQAQGKELADASKGSAGLALTFCRLRLSHICGDH